jgi:hypothetical protein
LNTNRIAPRGGTATIGGIMNLLNNMTGVDAGSQERTGEGLRSPDV